MNTVTSGHDAAVVLSRSIFELRGLSGEASDTSWHYFISFSSYILSIPWHVPITCIILGQSPYPRNIYPERAAAMSYDPRLTLGTFQEVPATVEVISQDISAVSRLTRDEVREWFMRGYVHAQDGIIIVNCGCFAEARSSHMDKESMLMVRFLSTVISRSSHMGVSSVDVFALGGVAKDAALKLRSFVDRSNVKVTVRDAVHPASVARKRGDTSLPYTLGKPAFSTALANVIMSSNVKLRERQTLTTELGKISDGSAKMSDVMSAFVANLRDASSPVIEKNHVIEVMSALAGSMMELSMSARNVAFFVNIGGSNTRAPLLASGETAINRYNPPPPRTNLDIETVTLMHNPSQQTPAMTPAEARRAKREARSAPSEPRSAPTDTPQETPSTSVADTASNATPQVQSSITNWATPVRAPQSSTITPLQGTHSGAPTEPTARKPSIAMSVSSVTSSPAEARKRAAMRRSSSQKPAPATLSGSEKRSLSVLADFMLANRDDAVDHYDLISKDILTGMSTCDITAAALRSIRADEAKHPGVSPYVLLGGDGSETSIVSNVYQFCMHYPSNVVV